MWLGADVHLSSIIVGASNLIARFTRSALRVQSTDGTLYVSTVPLTRRLAGQRMVLA